MSKYTAEALNEAKKVVSSLVRETSKGQTFQFDTFIQCLSEEIADFWQEEIKEGLAHFRLDEDGGLVYEGLCTEIKKSPADFYLTFGVKESTALENITDAELDIFTLVSSMKESHYKEKSKILESLDQISAEFDKRLVEVIKKAKAAKQVESANQSTKVAEDYLKLDIATKKQKLLDQLLKGK